MAHTQKKCIVCGADKRSDTRSLGQGFVKKGLKSHPLSDATPFFFVTVKLKEDWHYFAKRFPHLPQIQLRISKKEGFA